LSPRESAHIGVELSRLDLHREDRPVLRGLSWRIRPGERWVVLGGNGAGKTQLLKILSGDVWPDPAKHAARRYRFRGELHREPQSVREEIAYVGPERQDRYERYGWNPSALEVVGTGITRSDIPQGPLTASQLRRAHGGLQRLSLDKLADRPFQSMSYGERRLTLLARALAARPRLLLLDELLAGLDAVNRERALAWLDGTRRSAMPWVLTTHREEEIPRSATHLLVLEGGRILSCGPLRRDAAPVPLAALAAPGATAKPRRRQRAPGPERVALHAASVYLDYRPVLRDLELSVKAGDCWVVHGANGSGKSTLLRCIYGDHPVALGGTIVREGIAPGVPLAEFRRWTGLVAPHLQADCPRDASVLETVVSGLHASIGLEDEPTAREQARARRALAAFALEARAGDALRTLSYGQARRVMFARAWVARPRLLLLDEPFAGIDVATRAELLAMIEAAVQRGVSVVMTTHHPDEWPANASGELQLRRGRAVYCGVPRRRS
jgi:molybdate transport system ATP-binding protein